VLTQYKSHSLQKHLRDGWSIFNPSLGEYITPVPAQMRTGESWYVGTADAIYQNLYLIERSEADRVVILSGDHIYRMDYAAMCDFHAQKDADLTISCMEVPLEEARSFGVMGTDVADQVTEFHEKPAQPQPMPGHTDQALASMGIYVFKRDVLCAELERDHNDPNSSHDFGKDVIPRLIRSHRVFAYHFGGDAGRVTRDGYWRDVGTIDSYFAANMDLLRTDPPLNLYQADWPIRTYLPQTPPARLVANSAGHEPQVVNSILGGGVVIRGGTVLHSVLSPTVRVEDNATVSHSILFEGVTVGEGSLLRRCIVDKGVKIPPGTTIGVNPDKDARLFTVSPEGIVVVPRGYRFGAGVDALPIAASA
jgi:glucose-1-phosphate adenylyltransferase